MDQEAIIKAIDAMARDKSIDREVFFDAIEQALITAVRRKVEDPDSVGISIDRRTGEILRTGDAANLDTDELGRITVQTAKQVLFQKIREAERDQIFEEYNKKRGEIVTGTVQRIEGKPEAPNLLVNIGGRLEAFFPRKEQIFDERFNIGDRVRAVLIDVKKQGQRVRAILSRSSPIFVRKLFELEVPEIADRIIEIKAIEREAGHRTKVAVTSHDAKVDCVGACVGQRGSRIKGIIDELNGEKIDIVRWNDSPQILIENALRPARIKSITLDYDRRMARLVVPDDQLSLAIGKKGQNVRLSAKLCRWDLRIITETQEAEWRAATVQRFKDIPGVTEEMAYKIFDADFESCREIHEAGPERLLAIEGIDHDVAAQIIAHVAERPDGQAQVKDEVYYEGAFRLSDGRYLEPGQPKPGEFRISDDSSAGGALSAVGRFDQLFSSAAPGAAPVADAQSAGPKRIVLGDIFPNDRDR